MRDPFGYHNDVCEWCKTCPDCVATKANSHSSRAPLQSIKIGSPMHRAFSRVKSRKHLEEAFAIPNQEAARILTQEVFCRSSVDFPLPSSRKFEICKLLGISKTRTTPYHHGLVERFNRTLLRTAATKLLWSDHGSNFIGARSDIEVVKFLNAQIDISEFCTTQHIDWTRKSPSFWRIVGVGGKEYEVPSQACHVRCETYLRGVHHPNRGLYE